MKPLRGPWFSSYPPEDVTWLLTDLSEIQLEASTQVREAAMQSGRSHYSESLPVEYQPSRQYLELFHAALSASADRVAHAVGVVTELVLARKSRPVLVSLARAGTPVGVLMRRWATFAHGLDLPHYTISIVRGRGIDRVALRWLVERYDPADLAFVDGWTGKGAIARELRAALDEVALTDGYRLDPDLAVLADPGGCTPLFGTRDDFLVPSACLNSTVSGLVSRTVLNEAYMGPDDFHGAKFYRHLANEDVSQLFIDTVCSRFSTMVDQVAVDWPVLAAADRSPDWRGWRVTADIARRYGMTDLNLVKPGVGETTRVLLRRVPWRVLVDPAATADLSHVLLLAHQRGVAVEEVADLPYACVGIIRPVSAADSADSREAVFAK